MTHQNYFVYLLIIRIMVFSLVDGINNHNGTMFRYQQTDSKTEFTAGDKNRIMTGLEAGKAFSDFMVKKDFTTTLTKIASSVGLYLGVIGPFVGAIFSFISADSAEIQYMKSMMERIDKRLDRLDERFNDVSRMIDWTAFQVNFGQIEQRILLMAEELKLLYEIPRLGLQNRKGVFIMFYENDYQNSGLKLYHAVTKRQGVFQEDLGTAVMRYTQNHRRKTQVFLLGIMKLLLQAAKIELAYYRLNNYQHNEAFMAIKWEQRIANVTSKFETVDNNIKEKYHHQSGVDLDRLLSENTQMAFIDFSRILWQFLNERYYWRDWLVIVFRPSYSRRLVSLHQCGGHIRQWKHGKSVLIASVDENDPTMNIAKAKKQVKNVKQTQYNWWVGGVYNRFARDIYDDLDTRGACAVAIIKAFLHVKVYAKMNRFASHCNYDYYCVIMWG